MVTQLATPLLSVSRLRVSGAMPLLPHIHLWH